MRWIDRSAMPQIDEADLTALVEWLAFKGVTVETVTLSSKALRFRQSVERHLAPMPKAVYDKPVLIASDRYVLDGNHRARAHKLNGDSCRCLRLSCGFSEALEALFSFAGTYRLTPDTPIRN